MKISYNWLKWYVPEVPDAEKLADIFTYHLAEVESLDRLGISGMGEDWVFDINILPNRAHDLLSHQGVARELASLLNIPFVDPTPKYTIPESHPTKLIKTIETPLCRRYTGRIIRNIKVGPSPEWVKTHLELIGQRSINNIVDATNIVMYDCGQPAHVFDLAKIKDLKLSVRMAEKGQKISLLGGAEKELDATMMIIADEDNNALDIAGVKGGKYAELTAETKDIILEIANFDPTSVRKTAQKLNIFTDARKRFENDLSPTLAPYAMRELSALILEMCPDAIFEDIVDVYPKAQEERKLSFSAERISKILGLEVSQVEVEDILKRYNFTYRPLPGLPLTKGEEAGGGLEIDVPPMRLDLVIEEDMAEEVGRILGYDKVKPAIPKINFKPKVNETYAKISWARNKLLNEGYSEVMTYSFCDKGEVEVMESASDKKFLRTNLADGLKESLKLNQLNAPLLEMNEIKIFEIGTVFFRDREEIHVAYNEKKEIKEIKLEDYCKDTTGFVLEAKNYNLKASFKMWSLYPFIARDVAVWMPEGESPENLNKILKENAGELLVQEPYMFDTFTKNGKTSYAFRLIFQSYDRTLTDTEVNEIMAKITNKIKENIAWQIR